MNLPIIIGKGSNNDILQVDLKDLPHLFISFSEKEHINLFFKDAVNTITQAEVPGKIQFACALSREMYSVLNIYLKDAKLLLLFLRNETADPAGGSKYQFMQRLMKELRRRQKIKESKGNHSVDKLTPLIVIIDDIFDIIITNRKYTGLYFLELLAVGKEFGIHFLVASIWAYRNLISQLIKSRAEIKKPAGKLVSQKSQFNIQPLIAELIITPEDLYFFKSSSQLDYTRFFPIREGLAKPGFAN